MRKVLTQVKAGDGVSTHAYFSFRVLAPFIRADTASFRGYERKNISESSLVMVELTGVPMGRPAATCSLQNAGFRLGCVAGEFVQGGYCTAPSNLSAANRCSSLRRMRVIVT